MSTTIAIAGISSTLALLIAKLLLQQPDVHIRGSSRNINKIPDDLKSNSRISLVQSDPYDTETLRTLVRGCSVVICCYFSSNEVMLETQKSLIDLCEKEGIPRYIASDYTADYHKLDPTDLGIKNFTNDIGVHILVGHLIETFLDIFEVWYPEANELRYWGTGNEKWDLTSYWTAAEYVAAVALDPNASGFFKFRGDHKSIVEIANDVELVTGCKQVLKSKGPLTVLEKRLDGAGNIEQTLSASQYFTLTGKISFGDNIDNAKYPSVKPEAFSDVLRRRLK
ncbi:hypothetical protein COCCADRAFT_6116 [Bipolaris zeicola 26-R-13]|uniref:NAD(P)-binding domain-containing protein n=1 Tax=Cochliobolus carbonum (strain 26-R-13) TaxID=930089 RepID=W6Y9H1_COCC2|nr:uncharacterized protein COCCADRAFT_6116 [Bipolaris zeicola 26-R-13]EUC32069.1 hypothetical protein COCCADRAFT_6116 [Bipolaris zeicola 26-R-13]